MSYALQYAYRLLPVILLVQSMVCLNSPTSAVLPVVQLFAALQALLAPGSILMFDYLNELLFSQPGDFFGGLRLKKRLQSRLKSGMVPGNIEQLLQGYGFQLQEHLFGAELRERCAQLEGCTVPRGSTLAQGMVVARRMED